LSQPYRITVYIDGRCRQGQIAQVDKELTVMPNPAVDHTFIKVFSANQVSVELCITAATGQVILKKNFLLTEGDNQTEISTAALPAGLYFVSITDQDGYRKTVRLLKE
jgi:hypothetical protein